MGKIWAIAWKELYTTLIDRNLLLIMFASPLALSTIIGLAFGGLGADTPTLAQIPVAVVNLDQGIDLGAFTGGAAPLTTTQTMTTPFLASGFALNVGSVVERILRAEPITATGVISPVGADFDLSALRCDLVTTDDGATTSFATSLDQLLATTVLHDPAAARLGVEQGDYAAAVIIPPDFSQRFVPTFPFTATAGMTTTPAIEVYGNSGRTISAGVVRSIVESVVNQFQRLTVTLEASFVTLFATLDLTRLNTTTLASSLTGVNTDTFLLLGCLFQPGINPIQLTQQPLDQLQSGNAFARLVVVAGSGQAVFFALFTGVFGILSIYEERKQWTLQRMLVSPTTGRTILLGKLVGNLVVVFVQLLALLVALTVIVSLILGTPTFIWGTNLLALLGLLLSLSLCVSGLGVLIVGVARTPEQVQVIGPMINMALAVLGGAFGFGVSVVLARASLIHWAVDAFAKLAANEGGVGLNFLILTAQGLIFFLVGSWLFRRRLQL
ncbi:MAG: ABC-2 transporter permease [Caldilineaceae bacterium]|nr:ABC-2 transporter permease [Caldilineaceae bacterium]